MKLGIVGKGGVGKTTTSALLSKAFVAQGKRVIAIDTDSNPNLGLSLGLSLEETDAIPVLPRALVVGSGGDTTAEELIDQFGRTTPAGVTLMSGVRVTDAGAGCTCTGHATVRSFLGDALERHADVTLVDMEAGLEHLSRSGGTLAYADVLLIIMEPTRKSVLTAARTLTLAEELGIPRTYGVGNKARGDDDVQLFTDLCARYGVPLAGVIPFHDDVTLADRAGTGLGAGMGQAVRAQIDEIVAFLDGVAVAG